MRIKVKLALLFLLLFLIIGAMAAVMLEDQPLGLIAVELLLLATGILFFSYLGRLLRPLNQLVVGLDALKDQDFSGYLRTTGVVETDQLVEVYNRMLDNIRIERKSQQEQHFFLQNLIEALPVGLILLDFDDRVKQFNPTSADILGIQDHHIGTPVSSGQFLLASEMATQDIRLPRTYKVNATRYIRLYVDRFKNRGFYQKFVIVEEAGAEILQVEREAYGKVIRMMAHEVKNSVGAVNSILQTLEVAEQVSDEERMDYLKMVIERNKRLHAFMENFAQVVRIPSPGNAIFDLKETVQSVYHLMRLRFQHRPVEFALQVPDASVYLKGSQEQMEQVLINIVLNAFEAIADQGKVDLILRPDELVVVDTGTGISEEAKRGLFTPFFSTKPAGQGVGLTVVREILHQHGLLFALHSEKGLTRFAITLKQ